eukprot:1421487-Amphidinium_carterae.1
MHVLTLVQPEAIYHRILDWHDLQTQRSHWHLLSKVAKFRRPAATTLSLQGHSTVNHVLWPPHLVCVLGFLISVAQRSKSISVDFELPGASAVENLALPNPHTLPARPPSYSYVQLLLRPALQEVAFE